MRWAVLEIVVVHGVELSHVANVGTSRVSGGGLSPGRRGLSKLLRAGWRKVAWWSGVRRCGAE
ncbi:hypothetical protein ACIF85_02840 [Streptomyces sp. NPDC086033]|uniref:hypothetical protein n=1 Tax=Streptomyces sp. NPDC086033 TaxID=3365747 RepID=UPI0037CE8D4E